MARDDSPRLKTAGTQAVGGSRFRFCLLRHYLQRQEAGLNLFAGIGKIPPSSLNEIEKRKLSTAPLGRRRLADGQGPGSRRPSPADRGPRERSSRDRKDVGMAHWLERGSPGIRLQGQGRAAIPGRRRCSERSRRSSRFREPLHRRRVIFAVQLHAQPLPPQHPCGK